MIRIIIEKKAKYAIVSLCIVLVVMIASSSLGVNPVFSNSVQQVAKSSAGSESIDENNNGIVDEAETARTVLANGIKKIPRGCSDGYLMAGFGINGIPVCVRPAMKCSYDGTTNTCWVDVLQEDVALIEAIPVTINFVVQTKGHYYSTVIPLDFSFNENFLLGQSREFGEEKCHYNDFYVTICIKKVEVRQDGELYIKLYWTRNGWTAAGLSEVITTGTITSPTGSRTFRNEQNRDQLSYSEGEIEINA